MLVNYSRFQPQTATPFRDMDAKQARAYYEWFLQVIPHRLEELRHCLEANGGAGIPLDFTFESFALLSAWFGTKVGRRPLTAAELAQERAAMPEWLESEISQDTLTEETLSLCMDVGIYLGETFRRQYPKLKWERVTKPKRHAYLNQPVIANFSKNMTLKPFWICNIMAQKITLNGSDPQEELCSAINVWRNYVGD